MVFILLVNSVLIFCGNSLYHDYNTLDNKNLKNAAGFWATLSLTNPGEINNSRFLLDSTISIEGRLYNMIPPTSGKPGYTVAVEIDDVLDINFNDITDGNGDFQIYYTINPFLDVYSNHKISVTVTDSTPGNVENLDFYIIDVNTTSYFDISSHDDESIPKLTEETFSINGNLRYDNGQGIPFVSVNYYWLDGATIITQGSFFTDSTGSLISLQVPITLVSYLTLKFNYTNPPFVGYSERSISIKVFSDILWTYNFDHNPTGGDLYDLAGILYSNTDPSLRIGNRNITMYFNGSLTPDLTVMTEADGSFSSNAYRLPMQNGTASIRFELVNSVGKNVSDVEFILVEKAQLPIGGGSELPPFLLFSIIFFPILGSIIAVLVVIGIKFYKKQEKESRVVNLPLESKIKNLKILKDSGRLEESISYLFNAIYMDLINAKYSRIRNENETIRDFAIISVRELKLTPASIYPFIQKVEEIIYAKPFKITEKEFYNTCELFSPIYFQLTGFNFELNF